MVMIFAVGLVETKDLVHRLNYGTVFQEQPLLFATSEYWVRTFVLDLDPPEVFLLQRPSCLCPQVQSVFDKLQGYHNQTLNTIKAVTSNMLSILKSPHKCSKSKRSLLPFLGNIAKSLIGVSTSEKLDRVASNVAILHKENVKLSKTFQHELSLMSSFMSTANNRLDNALKGIQINHDMLEKLAENVSSSIITAAKQQELLLTVSLDQLKYFLLLQNEYQ